jgi:alkylation response protein AidB-like acyl-CoA dehydrogenase
MDMKVDQRVLLLEKARELKPLLRDMEEDMEKGRRLPEALRRAFLDAGFYSMWVPRSCGGLEVDPITYFNVIEEISSVSGSAGWNLMLGSSYGIFSGAIPPSVAATVFRDPDCILAGQISGMSGRAVAVPGGYRINGRWAFGSGILQSTYVLSNVTVYDGDEPRRDEKNRPMTRFVLVPRDKVQIIDTWFTLGLCGTGSNDYTIDDVFVPEEFVFERGHSRHQSGPLYKLVGAFAYTIPLPILGIARGAVDAFKEIAKTRKSRSGALVRDSEIVQHDVSRAEGLLTVARAGLWHAVGDMYQTAARGEPITPAHELRASLAQVEAANLAVQALDIVFDAAGGSTIYKGHPLERRFRDIHTARQHAAIGRNRRLSLGAELLT